MFVQRLHQFATLQEIGEKIEKGFVNTRELKHFLGQICCESYPNAAQFRSERDSLEANSPTYSESFECPESRQWGEWKLGRIPKFLFDDASWSVSSPSSAPAEDEGFKQQFSKALQYYMSRCQHHIHRLVVNPITKEEKRIVPHACASRKNKKECKHEAPWTNRVSPEWMKEPVLICKGIAKGLSSKRVACEIGWDRH